MIWRGKGESKHQIPSIKFQINSKMKKANKTQETRKPLKSSFSVRVIRNYNLDFVWDLVPRFTGLEFESRQVPINPPEIYGISAGGKELWLPDQSRGRRGFGSP